MSDRAEVYSLRMPEPLLRKLRRIARTRNIAASQLVRQWIEDGLNARNASQVSEAAMPYRTTTQESVSRSSIGVAIRAVAPDVARVCARHSVRTLTLFGSFAIGDARPDSDLDFCVDFEPLDPAARADAYFGLWTDLQRITDRTVDLVEREAVRNPFVRASIEETEVVLYESP